MTKQEQLTSLYQETLTCNKCGLCNYRKNIVFYKGNPDSDIVFIGEAPGEQEDIIGLPFVGRAGKLLDSMISAMGRSLDSALITNVINCRPPNNRKPTDEEMLACKYYFDNKLKIINPKVIIALGTTAMKSLTGHESGIMKLRGSWHKWNDIPVMLTLHPSFCLRRQDTKVLVRDDLKKVLDFLKE